MYYRLRQDSRFHCKYVYGAFECAASRLKLYRKIAKKKSFAKKPYILRNHLILENHAYSIENGIVRIPLESGKHLFVKLVGYVLKKLRDTKLGSLVITDDKLVISYSKEVSGQKTSEFIGIDRNLGNITTCDSNGRSTTYDLCRLNRIIASYITVKSKFRRNDYRIRKKIFQKYGRLQKNRVHNILHQTSKKIVSQNNGIIMENIKGIRKLYRRGNFQGRKFRRKMNSWSFYELQRQIEYKARWVGLSVEYVKACGTSSKCAVCGSRLIPEEHRMMICPSCKRSVDRDINAAKNILLRGTQVVPDGAVDEAMMTEPGRREPVISRVDAVKSGDGIYVPAT